MTLSELEDYLKSGDFRVEGDGERIWLEGPVGWRVAADDPPDTRLVLADEPEFIRKMLPTLQCLHVLERIAAALNLCRGIPTGELRRMVERDRQSVEQEIDLAPEAEPSDVEAEEEM